MLIFFYTSYILYIKHFVSQEQKGIHCEICDELNEKDTTDFLWL